MIIGSSWKFKRFDRICLTSIATRLEVLTIRKLILVFLLWNLLINTQKTDGSDDYDDVISADGDEVNNSDVEFADDVTNV